MDHDQKTRWGWIQLYLKTGDAGLVCRRCGISRPTLRKWYRRWKTSGEEGLSSQSRRPHTSPAAKITPEVEAWVQELRQRRLGPRRIQSELRRLQDGALALATIYKVLLRLNTAPLRRRRPHRAWQRSQRPIPGDRVQMDVCKIAPDLYQYTAIDDCTRYQVLRLYPRKTAAPTLRFLDQVLEEMPVPSQRLQTDRGREFFAYPVQQRLLDWGIKFRPIRPGSPHLNGKVERSQRTDWEEFYATVDLANPDLENQLSEWQHYYNWQRPHGALGGKTPMDRYLELSHDTPCWDEVEAMYDPARERIREQNYALDCRLEKLKRCL